MTPEPTAASQERSPGTGRRRDGRRLSPTVAVLVFAVLGLAGALLVVTSEGKSPAPQPQPAARARILRHRRTSLPKRAAIDDWPKGFEGFTVALASDLERSDAVGAVGKARSAGLPRVGMLVSADYSSLTPGYLFVFSGAYRSATEAQRYVAMARRAGFTDAYVRRVAE